MKTPEKTTFNVIIPIYSEKRLIGRITTGISYLNGNSSSYFSTTAEFYRANSRKIEMCGCCHEEILKHRPDLKPLVDMHLSDYPTGAPMHALENGYYWIAGACGGLNEPYHGGSGKDGKSMISCINIAKKHFRTTRDNIMKMRKIAKQFGKSGINLYMDIHFVDKWKQQAEKAEKFLRQLANEQEASNGK